MHIRLRDYRNRTKLQRSQSPAMAQSAYGTQSWHLSPLNKRGLIEAGYCVHGVLHCISLSPLNKRGLIEAIVVSSSMSTVDVLSPLNKRGLIEAC